MSAQARVAALLATSLVASVALAVSSAQDPAKAPTSAPTPPPAATPAAPTTPAAPATPAANLPKADELVKAFVDALGGKDAVGSITSSRFKGELEMLMGKMQIDMATMQPNKLRLVQTMAAGANTPGGGSETGCDGTIAWSTDLASNQTELLDKAMTNQLVEGSDFQAMVRSLDKVFSDMNTTGEETVDGTACWVVSMKSKNGGPTDSIFEKETKLLKALRMTQRSPRGLSTATVSFGNWTEHAVGDKKVKTFHSMLIEQEGMRVNGTFSDFQFNDLDASLFEAPAKVKELAKAAEEAAKAAPAAPLTAPVAPAAPAAPPAQKPDAPAKPQG